MKEQTMNETGFPLQMEALIEDSIAHIISHGDSQQFVDWIRKHIEDYYTGPDRRQGGLFSNPAVADPGQIILEPDMLHALAIKLATVIWNSIPLPSNNFRPLPMPVPKRNDPCLCGSGKKYKQCCAQLPDFPVLSADETWPIVFDKLDKETAARSIRENQVPINALVTIADGYLESDQPKKAAALLAPLFEGNIRKTNDAAEHALHLLCNAYDELGHNKKKTTLLLNITNNVGRSPLRSGAWQRLSTMRIDSGDADGAWAAFQNAQRDDPLSPGLGLLEVQILNGQGRNEDAAQRADFWVRKMRRAGIPDDEMPLAFLIEVAKDPIRAFANLGLEISDDSGLSLKHWLEMLHDRPIPDYSICEGNSGNDLGFESGMDALRKQLSGYGIDEDQIEEVLREMKDKSDDFRDDEQVPDEENILPETNVMSLQAPADLAELELKWHRIYPLDKPFSIHETPFGESDPWDVFEEEKWAPWLQDHPAAFDSLDILDDLATALMLHPQFGASWLNETLLLPLLQRSEAITDKALAAAGEPQLHWVMPGNRPALRAMARLVNIKLFMEDEQAEGIHRAQRLIAINPSDNHGYRTIVMNQLIKEGRDEEALRLAQQYPEDMNPEITFGKVLVLYRLGRQKEAVEEVGNAIEFLGKIPRYLTAKRIRKPKLHPDGVTYGGDDQAWYYREHMRDVWLQTPGALEWLKNAEKVFQ